jgi:3-hydroxypropanoate dehydrogenase
VDKTMAAPVTVVIATDPKFYEKMTVLFPARPQLVEGLAAMPAEKRDHMTTQASGLEAAYLILAARSLGLDCGPMGGFDREKVDATVLEGTGWKSQLLINVGYGDRSTLHPRLPRLEFDVACKVA